VKRVSGKRVCRVSSGLGWVLVRTTGSHPVYTHPGPPRRTVSVPVHGNADLKTGTQHRIMRATGVTDADI
jgi:predicted RNA binding protein YcfA (HicA-like mRNA interferase family)